MSQKDAKTLGKKCSLGFFFSLLILLWSSLAQARDTNLITPHTAEQPGAFHLIRSEEDYSAFIDPELRHGFLDNIKYLSLNEDKTNYLTLGGQFREEFQYYKFKDWGIYQTPDTRLKSRLMLDADLHLGQGQRFFLELKSGYLTLNSYAPGPYDVDHLDFNQIFYDQRWHFSSDQILTMRLGMSELDYGDERLISVREGSNIRLGFLGAKTIFNFGKSRLDTFWVLPVDTQVGVFDNRAHIGEQLWSEYFMAHPGGFDLDTYYIGFRKDGAHYVSGSGYELRHTIGARFASKQNKNKNGFDFDQEALYQFGSFSEQSISAWMIAIDPGYTLASLPWRPRFGLKAGIGSGDENQGKGSLGTFNPLFPRGGYLDLSTQIGQANLINLNPYVNLHPTDSFAVTTGFGALWRESPKDGVYSPSLVLERAPQGSSARYIGGEATITASYKTSKHFSLVLGYAYLFAGDFITETGPNTATRYGDFYLYFIF